MHLLLKETRMNKFCTIFSEVSSYKGNPVHFKNIWRRIPSLYIATSSDPVHARLKLSFRAENFRMVDIEINAWSPGFIKPKIRLIRIRYSRKKFKIQPISESCYDTLFNSWKTVFFCAFQYRLNERKFWNNDY